MAAPFKIVYATSSKFKIEENHLFAEHVILSDGVKVRDVCEFQIRDVSIRETLEVDIATMVKAESLAAYRALKVPCVVEHAGLIFDGFDSYPGGLTKPMWNELGDKFVPATGSAGRKAVARAVVAYCDGSQIATFVGQTAGRLSAEPRGDRKFYWDTVFIPDKADGTPGDKTYAEIVAAKDGLIDKVVNLSQSTKAMRSFVEFRRSVGPPHLWPRDN
jgi:inosine/xanthosine triphosphate pyrophosphatase family protein